MKSSKLMGVLMMQENEDGIYMPELHTFVFDPATQTPEEAHSILMEFIKSQKVGSGQYFIFDMRMVPFMAALFDSALENQEGPDEHDTIN